MTRTTELSRLMDQRVRALAIMHLTRRRDLVIRDSSENLGFDLTVQIVRNEKPGLRQFGVELKGVRESLT
ncbi:MAG TPA: hypothetical protein VML55_24340, partial [Planctomycetaceae bacterium]|nr:hypothetical protein [Planctomycetaceae bacterium]